MLNKAVKSLVESSDAAVDDSCAKIHFVPKTIQGIGRVSFYYFAPSSSQDMKRPSHPGNVDMAGWLKLYQVGETKCQEYLDNVRRERERPKRQRKDLDDIVIGINQLDLQKAGKKKPKPLEEYEWSAFDATEHKNVFSPNEGETLEECLDRQIDLLTKAINNENGYKLIVPNGDPHDYYTSGQKALLHRRAMYMRRAYMVAKENLNDIDAGVYEPGTRFSFQMCCSEAIDYIHTNVGYPKMQADTLMDWNRLFRELDMFPHVNQVCATGRQPEPALFELFQEAKQRILGFATANIDTFSLESVKNDMNDNLLPDLLESYNETLCDSISDSQYAWWNYIDISVI